MVINTVEDIVKELFKKLQTPNNQLLDYKSRFAKLQTNLERINFVLMDMEKFNLFPMLSADGKNDPIAVKHREKGNKRFNSGNLMAAIEEYTLSIATAKTDSILALAYGNRSTCLHKLKMYQACIDDIDRAFASNYSGERKKKLIMRRKEAEKLVKPVEKYHEEIPGIPESRKNPLIQSASDCVKIALNEQFGRHVVATRNIEIGEVISVEEAFACVIRKDELFHCHECLTLCYNLIPCRNCTRTLYCGEVCKCKAYERHHKYVCPILLSLDRLGIAWMLAPLKIAILARGDYDKLDTFTFSLNEYYRSDRYKEIHGLMAVVPKVFEEEFFLKTVSSAIVYHLIKTKTDLLENQIIEDTFKEMILLQVQIVSLNGINLYEYLQASDFPCYDDNEIAGGVYSFTSLYNHSCCRNVFRISYGSTIVIRAINTIKKGEQCFINYGSHYDDSSPRFVRQLTLYRNFLFKCNCKACQEDWERHLMPFSNALDLSPASKKVTIIQNMMATADVKFAKQYLPQLIEALKQHEASEPYGKALTLKKMIQHCFNTLGNKRRI